MPKPSPRGAAFGALLRQAREHLDLTQEKVCELSGVSRSTYGRWESGEAHKPGPDEVRAVCAVLNIHPGQAAVALGYLSAVDFAGHREELAPDLEEVIDILRDPRIPSVAKEALMGYLRQLRHQASANPGERRAG